MKKSIYLLIGFVALLFSSCTDSEIAGGEFIKTANPNFSNSSSHWLYIMVFALIAIAVIIIGIIFYLKHKK